MASQLNLAALIVLTAGLGACGRYPSSIEVDGRELERRTETKSPSYMAGAAGMLPPMTTTTYAPEGEHVLTAAHLVYLHHFEGGLGDLLHVQERLRMETADRELHFVPLRSSCPGGSGDGCAQCIVFVSPIGQPTIAIQVADADHGALRPTVAVEVVDKLDNLQQVQKWVELCAAQAPRFEGLWKLHREIFGSMD